MNPERCHCGECRQEPLYKPLVNLSFPELHAEIYRLRDVVQVAIETAYDPARQPLLVLTLIENGFIKTSRDEFPKLEG